MVAELSEAPQTRRKSSATHYHGWHHPEPATAQPGIRQYGHMTWEAVTGTAALAPHSRGSPRPLPPSGQRPTPAVADN
jgi:hypothetical protein